MTQCHQLVDNVVEDDLKITSNYICHGHFNVLDEFNLLLGKKQICLEITDKDNIIVAQFILAKVCQSRVHAVLELT